MPGTKGNTNALKHGKFSFLMLGRLPKGCSYIARQRNQMRRALTESVETIHGEITLPKGALIQSVCLHSCRAMLLQRWLAAGDALPLADRRGLLQEIAAAVEARDKALRAIGLDKAPADPADEWAELDRQQAATGPGGSP